MPDTPRPHHEHTTEEERQNREAALDETIAESFPASDPPSSIPNPDTEDPGVDTQRETSRQPTHRTRPR